MNLRSTAPFYESEATSASRGRLLLFAYHFPPAESAGSLRWQKLAGHAADRGWHLDVLTRDPAELHLQDPTRLKELPPGTRVFGIPQPTLLARRIEQLFWGGLLRRAFRRGGVDASSEPVVTIPDGPSSFAASELTFEPRSLRSWVRSYEGWAEYASHRAWAKEGVGRITQMFPADTHRAFISSGPPHGIHLGPFLMHRKTGRPFVLDLRDPWSISERWVEPIASSMTARLAERYESHAVSRAALIVMNTEPARDAMRAHYPRYADKIIAAMNGFDPEDAPPHVPRDACFRMRYAGTVYLDRSPRTLFQALARAVRRLAITPEELQVEFMGAIHPDRDAVLGAAREEDVEAFVKLHEPGGRRDAARFLAGATALVSLPQDSHMAIPSKVFEYLQYDAWILALAERDSASERVLRDSGADVADPGDLDTIEQVLTTRFRSFREGVRPAALAPNTQLSRKLQAERLFDALETAIDA